MSGRIDAATRLLSVASSELGNVRSSMEGFIAATKTAELGTRGIAALDEAREGASRVMAAIEMTRTAGVSDLGSPLKQATDGVDHIFGQLELVRNAVKGTGTMELKSSTLRAITDDAEAAVREAYEKVVAIQDPTDKVATRSEIQAFADEALPNLKTPTTKLHADQVVASAANVNTSAARMPTLVKAGVYMNEQALDGRYAGLVGRVDEIRKITTTLGHQGKGNPVLLGEAGVGKTQIIEGYVAALVRGELPTDAGRQVYLLEMGKLKAIAGGAPNALDGLINDIVSEVVRERRRGADIVLAIDEAHTLVGTGDIGNQLKPAMANGDLKAVLATTFDEYAKSIEKNDALKRRVTAIFVEEQSTGEVHNILSARIPGWERHHKVVVDPSILDTAQKFSGRYRRTMSQPDPAIELVDHAASLTATSWHGADPIELAHVKNRISQIEFETRQIDDQLVFGAENQAGLGANLHELHTELGELRPKLEALHMQLADERSVLSVHDEVVNEFKQLRAAGNDEEAATLIGRISEANAAVAALRGRYENRLLSNVVDREALVNAANDLYEQAIPKNDADAARKILATEQELAKVVKGQAHAIHEVAESFIGKAGGMNDPDATKGVYFFLGPTGVGKTETAKAINLLDTGDPKNLIRIDGGEYMEKHAIARLFGAPPGYVGFDGTAIFEEIAKRPNAHVLIDEFEKMHPDTQRALLALLDEGRITIGNGKPIDATGITVYLTSNLSEADLRTELVPEFLNRLDHIISFQQLEPTNLKSILTDVQLPRTLGRAKARGLDVTVTAAAQDRILELGTDLQFGARPLKRSIIKHVEDPAGRMSLELQARGLRLDPFAPHPTTLDVAEDGGFIMRSVLNDEAIEVPVAARNQRDHVPGGGSPTHKPVLTTGAE